MRLADDQQRTTNDEPAPPQLIRGIGLGSATALNMIDMIGWAVHYYAPDRERDGRTAAILGWIAGALLATCDGLVCAELSSAMPGSGGSYRYLREIYGPHGWDG